MLTGRYLDATWMLPGLLLGVGLVLTWCWLGINFLWADATLVGAPDYLGTLTWYNPGLNLLHIQATWITSWMCTWA